MANELNVFNNIKNIFKRRKMQIYGLALQYAALAINDFRKRQGSGEFWNNQTNTAMNTMFTNAFIEGDTIGWFMSHSVEYGTYLELANDERHAAIRPIINKWGPMFISAVKKLYSDAA